MATPHNRLQEDHGSQFLTETFQRGLARWNHMRLSPRHPNEDSDMFERELRMLRLERAFLAHLRSDVVAEASDVPQDADGFITWFEGLKDSGPGQGDPLFPWLAEEAGRDQLRWFFEQEAAGEAGFDDLVALTQVKMPARAKLELARNYWDEMGRGNPAGMHGPMLDALVEILDVDPTIDDTVWESLALANAMTAMATHRDYAWHSVGALGVIELTAPGRSALVAKGLRRIGLSDRERRYFDLHAVLDVKHSADWNSEAIRPLIEEDPTRATAMAEGALIRLRCGARCFDRYRAILWK
ncbi:iron-containing redox enzyme family protein [Rhizorhabdus sp.]|uniref:iron-containing redox enzyme family protein n=1 Tax=Rhizorhabdus sp. TaxID=1968843 RepID=UPI001B55CE8B|nr:iron-containing redox enzyme family protein [Rhizorhabdus sp.]MBP8234265.1 iron-containing redox enzyme family protein [Rhizorhabdus sp.]